MVNRNVLIGKVSPFLNKKEVIVGNQDTTDIIDALIKNHYKYSTEYDKIFRYFDGGNVEETAFNVWQFLKDDFKYTIEPEKMQILRSPAAILASNMIGIDCKGYATFANGVMDAYRRNTGKKFDVYYRFASYDSFDNTPQHVFSVIKENGNEYWIDPVLDQFNEKKQPYFYKDIKIKNMALVAMSGIRKRIGDDPTNFDPNAGTTIDTGSATDLTYSGGQYYDVAGNLVDQSGNLPTNVTAPAATSTTTSTSALSSFLSSAASVLKVFAPTPAKATPVYNPATGTYTTPVYNPTTGTYTTTAPTSTGISTNTIFLLGAAGLAAYFLLKKK